LLIAAAAIPLRVDQAAGLDVPAVQAQTAAAATSRGRVLSVMGKVKY